MSAYTLGSVIVLPNNMFNLADNYQNSRDGVCGIANFLNNNKNVNIINTGDYSGLPFTSAHAIQSEGYDSALRDICKDILREELK